MYFALENVVCFKKISEMSRNGVWKISIYGFVNTCICTVTTVICHYAGHSDVTVAVIIGYPDTTVDMNV
jgi:putative flippase GtrA